MFRSRFAVVATLSLATSLIAVACAKSPEALASSPIVLNDRQNDAQNDTQQLAADAAAKIAALQASRVAETPDPITHPPRAPEKNPIVVLVPGFFNSITPGHYDDKDGWINYFSAAVISTIAKRGYTVVMPDKLAPIGTIEANGQTLENFLRLLQKKFANRKMILIAHSAGGLYSMYALSRNPDLPVQTVITIATPYEGVEFVDNLAMNVPGLDQLADWLNLDGIRQFRKSIVQPAIRELKVPVGVRWIAVGGTQEPCLLLECSSSRYLSWVLSIAQRMMTESSDGVVTLSSALGTNTQLLHSDGRRVPMERWADFSFDLEHWKMVEEADLFLALGVVDTGRIRSEQRRYFNEIMDRLAQ